MHRMADRATTSCAMPAAPKVAGHWRFAAEAAISEACGQPLA